MDLLIIQHIGKRLHRSVGATPFFKICELRHTIVRMQTREARPRFGALIVHPTASRLVTSHTSRRGGLATLNRLGVNVLCPSPSPEQSHPKGSNRYAAAQTSFYLVIHKTLAINVYI